MTDELKAGPVAGVRRSRPTSDDGAQSILQDGNRLARRTSAIGWPFLNVFRLNSQDRPPRRFAWKQSTLARSRERFYWKRPRTSEWRTRPGALAALRAWRPGPYELFALVALGLNLVLVISLAPLRRAWVPPVPGAALWLAAAFSAVLLFLIWGLANVEGR